MESASTVADFLRAHGALDRARFIAAFTHPFLLVDFSGSTTRPGDLTTRGPTEAHELIAESGAPRPKAANQWVLPVVKSARDLDPERITLGRATNNDLVIPHGSVSKLHAFFRKHPGAERYTLFDAGSSFGTTLNGMAVDKETGRLLSSGDTMVFAKAVPAKFYLPKEFFEFIHALKKAERSRIL